MSQAGKNPKETKTSGGTDIEVKDTPVEIPEEKETPEQLPEVEAGAGVNLVNEALIETVVRVIGKSLALITKIPEMDFDEAETEQLKNLWSPLVPSFSPTAMAIIGTAVIAGGKIGVYVSKRPKKVKEVHKGAESPEAAKEAKTIEQSLEEEWKHD